jgi:hypothetical protein
MALASHTCDRSSDVGWQVCDFEMVENFPLMLQRLGVRRHLPRRRENRPGSSVDDPVTTP